VTERFLRNNPKEGGAMDYRNSEFQRLLYQLLIYDKRFSILTLAEELGKKPDTIYAYAEGEVRLHIDEARRIIRAVGKTEPDIALELINYFVPTGFRVVRESNVKGAGSDDLRDQQLDLSRLVGRIQDLIKEAQADGRIDRAEHRLISRKVATLKTIATELDERLKGEVL